ncbi:MAG: hypothetical protein AB2A00_22050 [Myxococcota bacterium]
MMAWVMLGALLVSDVAPPARAVVMPLRAGPNLPADVAEQARGLERMLVDALNRHAPFRAMGRDEIVAMAGAEAAHQLQGCEAESCLADIANALNAELVVSAGLRAFRRGLALDASLVRRADAHVLRRASVHAPSLGALLVSIDVIARQLAGGARIAADDPRLAARLGTTPAVAEEVAQVVRTSPDTDVMTEWTRRIIQANSEPGFHPLAVGTLVLAAGACVLMAGAVAGFATGLSYYATTLQGPPPDETLEGWELPAYPNRINPDGTYNFPVLHLLIPLLAPVPLLLLGGVALLAAAGVAVHDRMDVGRIPVASTGCCRDEEELAEARRPTAARRAGPVLATLGSLLALGAPWCLPVMLLGGMFCGTLGAFDGAAFIGPTVPLRVSDFTAAAVFASTWHALSLGALSVGCAAVGIGSALALVGTDSHSLVDDEE